MTTVVYRGVLQRSRLRLLLEALADESQANKMIWLSTRPIDQEHVRRLSDIISDLSMPYGWEILDGSISSFPSARRRLRSILGESQEAVVAIGQSALPYLPKGDRAIVLCMNGIPEERVLQRPGVVSMSWSRAAWAVYRISLRRHPKVTAVTVSKRMSELVGQRLKTTHGAVAPTAAGEQYFEPELTPTDARTYDFCYQGSGAAWQNLDFLNSVWRAVAATRPESTFLVVSYDKRCRSLETGMPMGSVRFVEAFEPEEVAKWLLRSSVGFVLRSPDIVNRVSYPTKIGESLACGVSLVASDIDWDPAELLADERVARLVDPDLNPQEVADVSIELLEATSDDTIEICRETAQHLRRVNVVRRLRAQLEAAKALPR